MKRRISVAVWNRLPGPTKLSFWIPEALIPHASAATTDKVYETDWPGFGIQKQRAG
jgi:hypothetical protein